VTQRQLFVAAFGGMASEAVPVYEQSFASEVASKILGREAFTGAVMLHYQEAVWAVRGPQAYAEFRERVCRDVVELYRTLGFGALAPPWLGGAPVKQVGEYEFLYGDPDGYWVIKRYDPHTMTYGPVRYSHPPRWRGPEAIRQAVTDLQRLAERYVEDGHAAAQEAHFRHWLSVAGDEFELLGSAGLSVPLNEEWLTACALVPEMVADYLDAQVEIGRQQMQIQARLGLRIVWGGGDLADNHGPLYGPRFFNTIVLPRYKRLVQACHELGMKYVFRSDGDLTTIADGLFGEAGVDGFGEIDYDAGMRIPLLQERYPHLTCWGNISCRLLRNGTPEQVGAAAEELVEQCQARGRLILGSSNTVLPGTPPENYYALLEVARRRR
jgi:hypothetical protein